MTISWGGVRPVTPLVARPANELYGERARAPWRRSLFRSWPLLAPGGEARLLLDARGTVLSANGAAAALLDGVDHRLDGRCIFDLLPEASAGRWREQLRGLSATGEATSFADQQDGAAVTVTMRAVFDSEDLTRITAVRLHPAVRSPSNDQAPALLLDAAIELCGASTGAEVCAIVAERVLAMTRGGAVVFVAERERGAQAARLPAMRASAGAEEELLEVLDRDPLSVHRALAAIFEHTLATDRVVRLAARNSGGPEVVVDSIGKELTSLLDLGEIFAVALRDGTEVLGYVAMLVGAGGRVPDSAVMERLVGCAASTLARCRVAEAGRAAEESRRYIEVMAALRAAAGAVGREFEEALSVIGCHAYELAESWPGERFGELGIDVIQEAAERAAHLAAQLLTFAGRRPRPRELWLLNRIIEQLLDRIPRLLGDQVKVVPALAASLWSVVGDRGDLEKILINLVLNARDAMPDGGVLTIATSNVDIDAGDPSLPPGFPAGRYARLRVSDSGHGMDRATLEQACHPCFSGNQLALAAGLGLSEVYGIVQQAGGCMAIDSQVGVGTSVTILLPAAGERPAGTDRAADEG